MTNLIFKALIYRVIRLGIVFLSAIFILKDTQDALSIAGLDTVVATIFYYWYDKLWPILDIKITSIKRKIKYRKLNK